MGEAEWKKRSPFSIHGAFDVILITPQSALPALVVLLPPLLGRSSLPCFASSLVRTCRAVTLLTTKLP